MKSQNLKCLLFIIVTALLTAFITWYLCRMKYIDDIPDKDRSATICMDYETQPPALLPAEVVRSMVTNYGDLQLNNIQTAPTNAVPVDAKAIWFDLETIKKFIYQIEHNANTNFAQSQNKKLGIRIYYASYPKNTQMAQMALNDPNFYYNPSYENLHTLVMIPTISGANNDNYDFNPLDVNSYTGFTNMKRNGVDPFADPSYSILSFGPSCEPELESPTPNQTSARNHGTLIPPAVGSGLFF